MSLSQKVHNPRCLAHLSEFMAMTGGECKIRMKGYGSRYSHNDCRQGLARLIQRRHEGAVIMI